MLSELDPEQYLLKSSQMVLSAQFHLRVAVYSPMRIILLLSWSGVVCEVLLTLSVWPYLPSLHGP